MTKNRQKKKRKKRKEVPLHYSSMAAWKKPNQTTNWCFMKTACRVLKHLLNCCCYFISSPTAFYLWATVPEPTVNLTQMFLDCGMKTEYPERENMREHEHQTKKLVKQNLCQESLSLGLISNSSNKIKFIQLWLPQINCKTHISPTHWGVMMADQMLDMLEINAKDELKWQENKW